MKTESVTEAIALAKQMGHVFVATADDEGRPHIAVAGEVKYVKEGRLAVSAWFCPVTLSNLQINRHIALVVWDKDRDAGYQVLGESEKIEGVAMMDGYTPTLEKPIPQVERRITMRVTKVTDFMHAVHTDL